MGCIAPRTAQRAGAPTGAMGWDPIDVRAMRELCRDQHCRIALAVLAEEDRRLTVNDLTKAICSHNHHALLSDVAAGEIEAIHRSLEDRYLPRIARAGLVEYDAERGLVEPTERLERARPHVDAIVDADDELEGPLEL